MWGPLVISERPYPTVKRNGAEKVKRDNVFCLGTTMHLGLSPARSASDFCLLNKDSQESEVYLR